MTWSLHRHDARRVSELLEPESVDLIVTSPPYFALRSYRDECEACGGDGQWREGVEAKPPPPITPNNNGQGSSTLNHGRGGAGYEAGVNVQTPIPGGCPACNGSGRAHYDGQLESEATPGEFVDNLIACTADWLKVLKPTGSLFVNLGDKYSGAPGQMVRTAGRSVIAGTVETTHDAVAAEYWRGRGTTGHGIPAKSRMGLPWRYAIRCIDELGLILRADIIWSKPNGLPESVTDRVRMSHEYLFHFTRQGRYFAAIDEIREAHQPESAERARQGWKNGSAAWEARVNSNLRPTEGYEVNPLGKSPGSVWTLPSEPLSVPDHLGVDHFAAYPSELVRRCVLGWTPSGWCTACGEARRPVVDRSTVVTQHAVTAMHKAAESNWGSDMAFADRKATTATITGYACACTPYTDHPAEETGSWDRGRGRDDGKRNHPERDENGNRPTGPKPSTREYHFDGWTAAPTTPAVVLDPFAGTGTTVLVADQLGRHGIGTDLSNDYLRLAEWRIRHDSHTHRKVRDRSGLATPQPPKVDGQLGLFEGLA